MTATAWNPFDKAYTVDLIDADLTAIVDPFWYDNGTVRATDSKSSGKWYFEVQVTGVADGASVGVMKSSDSLTVGVGAYPTGYGLWLQTTYYLYSAMNNFVQTQLSASVPVDGDIVMVAVDLTAGKIWFGVNGTWFGNTLGGSGDPATASNPAYTGLSGTFYPSWGGHYGAATVIKTGTAHFTVPDLVYSVPSGFLQWGPEPDYVGTADGFATVEGDTNVRDAVAGGYAIADATTNVAVGEANGVATVEGVGMPGIMESVGTCTCVSWARGKPPYTIKVMSGSLITLDRAWQGSYPSGGIEQNPTSRLSAANLAKLKDGFTFGPGKGCDISPGNPVGIRLSFTGLAWIAGIRIYSGKSVLESRTTEPPDNLTYRGSMTYSINISGTAGQYEGAHDLGAISGITSVIAVAGPENVFAPVPQINNMDGTFPAVGTLNESGGAVVRTDGWWLDTNVGYPTFADPYYDKPYPAAGAQHGGLRSGVSIDEAAWAQPLRSHISSQTLFPTFAQANTYTSAPDPVFGAYDATHLAPAKITLLFRDSANYTAEKHTGYIDVGIGADEATATIYEIQVLYLALDILGEIVEHVNATEHIKLYHVVTAVPSSTANATSTVFTFDALTCVSTANATSVVSGSGAHDIALVSRANAKSTASGVRTLTLTSTANATSAVSHLPRTLELVSTANATSVVATLGGATATYVSTAHATSTVLGFRVVRLVSTANATSQTSATRKVFVTLQSSANATSQVEHSAHIVFSLRSTAVASSVVSTQLTAHQILLSSANATSHIILADSVLQSLWVNAANVAAGTWSGTPFESMVEVDGEFYAAGRDGIYRMSDELDDEGLAISAEMRWDLMTYRDVQRHRPGEAYIAGASAGPLNVRVVNEQGAYNYPTQLAKNSKDVNLRARFGKGVMSRFIRIAVTNPNGVFFSIQEAELEMIILARQIGGKHG